MKPIIINATVAMDLTAAGEKRPTFAINANSGEPMKIEGQANQIVLDLSGLGYGKTLPILLDHNPEQIVGIANQIEVTGGVLKLTGVVTGQYDTAGDPAHKVVSHAKGGFSWAASVGVSPEKTDYIAAGKTGRANNRDYAGPVAIVRRGRLGETSFVAVGADKTANAVVYAKGSHMFEHWLSAKGIEGYDQMTPKNQASIKAMFDAEQGGGVATVKAAGEILAAQVDDVVDTAIQEKPCYTEQYEKIRASAHLLGWETDKVERKITHVRADPRIGAPRRHRQPDNRIDVLACAYSMHLGLRLPEKTWTPQVLQAAEDMKHMVPVVLKAAGSGDERTIMASGYSTGDNATALSNLANLSVTRTFDIYPRTSVSWIGPRSSTNFKVQSDDRPFVKGGTLEELGTGGEIKHVALGEEVLERQAKVFAKMLTVPYQSMKNDQIGYYMEAVNELARNALRTHEDLVYKTLMANAGSFFHAANNDNLLTSGTSVLSFDSLALAIRKIRSRVDGDGMTIGLTPKTLVVGPALEMAAKALVNSTTLMRDQSEDNMATSNPLSGLTVEVEPRLGNTNIHASATDAQWYLFADQNQAPAMCVTYVDDKRSPTLQDVTAQLPPNMLGYAWRVLWDFGCDLYESRAAVRSAGA